MKTNELKISKEIVFSGTLEDDTTIDISYSSFNDSMDMYIESGTSTNCITFPTVEAYIEFVSTLADVSTKIVKFKTEEY